jgi:hypothetical protein
MLQLDVSQASRLLSTEKPSRMDYGHAREHERIDAVARHGVNKDSAFDIRQRSMSSQRLLGVIANITEIAIDSKPHRGKSHCDWPFTHKWMGNNVP